VKRVLLDVNIPWLGPWSLGAHVPCQLCGTFRYYSIGQIIINDRIFFLVHCRDCGLIWKNPMPDEAFLCDLYKPEYFSQDRGDLHFHVGISDGTPEEHARRAAIGVEEVERWQEKGVIPYKSGALLEIGGGRGYLQQAAQAAGWNTTGLEICSIGMRSSFDNNLRVLPIDVDRLSTLVPNGYFELIAFYDFLEHVCDPAGFLRSIRRLLHPDGTVVLRIPCIDDSEIPLYHLVDHIWHFNEVTATSLFEQCGFRIEASEDSGQFPKKGGQVQNVTLYLSKVIDP
jgi:SAM-dependent methyltransferase